MSDSIVSFISLDGPISCCIIRPMPQEDVDELDAYLKSINARRTGMVIGFDSKESLAEFLLTYA